VEKKTTFWKVEKEWATLSSNIFKDSLKSNPTLLGLPTSFRDPESCVFFHNSDIKMGWLFFLVKRIKAIIRLSRGFLWGILDGSKSLSKILETI
jgi:hypothetical protein